MISVVICTKDEETIAELLENIKFTIGVPYEIITILNPKGKFGLCEAYNQGAMSAKFEYLCFMHDDIFYSKIFWGQSIIKELSNKTVGLIGIAGAKGFSIVPSLWGLWGTLSSNRYNFTQFHKYLKRDPIFYRSSPDKDQDNQVSVIDGVWMCTRKDVFQTFQFDDKLFTGFHGYDMDYSLQVRQQYEVRVIFDVDICHVSEGKLDRQWLESAIRLSQKWQKKLPVYLSKQDKYELRKNHKTAIKYVIDLMVHNQFSFKEILDTVALCTLGHYFTPIIFFRCARHLLKKWKESKTTHQILNNDFKKTYSV